MTELEKLRDTLKRGGHLRRYLEETGRAINQGGQLSCPNTSAHPNGDRHPSAHLYEDGSGDRVKCFACGGLWDVFSLDLMDNGGDFPASLQRLAARFGLEYPARAAKRVERSRIQVKAETATEPPAAKTEPRGRSADAQRYLDECAKRLGEADYLRRRGISDETAKRLGCGFDPACYFPSLHKREPAVVFPAALGWAARAIPEKAHTFTRGINGGAAFNLAALDVDDPTSAAFVVEGQTDALSIEECGGHAVALGGVQHIAELVEAVRRKRPRIPLVVSLDNEANPQKAATVRKAAERLERELEEAGAFVWRHAEPVFAAHDANDALLADRAKFRSDIEAAVFAASEAYVLRDAEKDGDEKPEASGAWEKRTVSFRDIPEPVSEDEDPACLFRNGWLRKGHAACLVSVAGVGKSVISLQLALSWAVGKACFGIEPTRPLRIGVFSFEDDERENAEFRAAFRKGFPREGWTPDEVERALACVDFIDLEGRADERFAEALVELQHEKPRDLYVINPLGDVADETDLTDNTSAKHFFKRVLDPVIKGTADPATSCGLLLVHHTGKAPKAASDRSSFMRGAFAQYDASGASALMNWTRSSLLVAPTDDPRDFILLGAKRQARLGWRDAEGKPTNQRFISHSDDITFWVDTPEDRVRKLAEGSKTKAAVDPKADAIKLANHLRGLEAAVSLTNARQIAQQLFGQARGNTAFDTVSRSPAAYNLPFSKTGRTVYIGGSPGGGLALGVPPPVDGVDDIADEPDPYS